MEEKIELQHLVCNCCGEDIGNDDYYEFNGSISVSCVAAVHGNYAVTRFNRHINAVHSVAYVV